MGGCFYHQTAKQALLDSFGRETSNLCWLGWAAKD